MKRITRISHTELKGLAIHHMKAEKKKKRKRKRKKRKGKAVMIIRTADR